MVKLATQTALPHSQALYGLVVKGIVDQGDALVMVGGVPALDLFSQCLAFAG
jgi:hypothetical protein